MLLLKGLGKSSQTFKADGGLFLEPKRLSLECGLFGFILVLVYIFIICTEGDHTFQVLWLLLHVFFSFLGTITLNYSFYHLQLQCLMLKGYFCFTKIKTFKKNFFLLKSS